MDKLTKNEKRILIQRNNIIQNYQSKIGKRYSGFSIFTKFMVMFNMGPDFDVITNIVIKTKYVAAIWNMLSGQEKEIFNEERNKVNAIEKMFFDQHGILPENNILYGDRWANGGEDIDMLKSIILKYSANVQMPDYFVQKALAYIPPPKPPSATRTKREKKDVF